MSPRPRSRSASDSDSMRGRGRESENEQHGRSRKKRRRDSGNAAVDTSSGSDDSDDDAARRGRGGKRVQKEKKKKEKQSKKDKKARKKKSKMHSRKHHRRDASRNRERDGSRSESNNRGVSGPVPDYEHAFVIVKELLTEFPSIAHDLLSLLSMLDKGEVAVLSGIGNTRVKELLSTLFSTLGLVMLRKPTDAFTARGRRETSSLLEIVAKMLGNGDDVCSTEASALSNDVAAEPSNANAHVLESKVGVHNADQQLKRRAAPIGPMMPPSAMPTVVMSEHANDDEDEEDDGAVGPALPGMKGFRVADERVEAEMAQLAKTLEEREWRSARGESHEAVGGSSSKPAMVREDWMTQMPHNNKIFQDALGPSMQRASGKPAAFRSKEPASIDRTWFDSPEERERANRAKLDMELLGYVREENAPSLGAVVGPSLPRGSNASGVNESIMPLANPEADEDMRRQMEQLKRRRGPSLLEQHQQRMTEKAKRGGGGDRAERATWDRERDLVTRKSMSREDADRVINASKQISSKFTAPTVTRQFL